MRFMVMHRHDAHTEAGEKPPKELIERMGAFVGQYLASGVFVDGAGLGASKTRTRLVFKDGQCTKKRGPYSGDNELPAATLLLKTSTLDEALGWAERYGKILGTVELELGKINEPWDLGIMPEPPNAPLQFLLIEKADSQTEAGGRSSDQKAALSRLKTEMTKVGVLQRGYDLLPSRHAKRLIFTNNKLRTIDGPFAESKELVGGFSVLELPDVDAVLALCVDYAEILGGTLEIDVRPLAKEE